jgi:SAM-dependent methyltransferase
MIGRAAGRRAGVSMGWFFGLWSAGIARAQRLGDRTFDRVMGIDTASPVETAQLGFGPETGNPYVPSNWVNLIGLARMLRALDGGPGTGFLDLGCGKGQVIFLVARTFPFRHIVGLDLSEEMIASARRNLDPARHRFRSPNVELVVGDAGDYPIPGDVDTCYLYNPFPRPVMERVMAQLDATLAAHPRRMRLFYLESPDADLLVQHGFREVRRIRRLRLFVREPEEAADH